MSKEGNLAGLIWGQKKSFILPQATLGFLLEPNPVPSAPACQAVSTLTTSDYCHLLQNFYFFWDRVMTEGSGLGP